MASKNKMAKPTKAIKAIYRRTGVKVEIVRVNPPKGWPDHFLRAVFDTGEGFTFHSRMLHEWFEVERGAESMITKEKT
jgi:hypothetical protein